MLSYVSAYCKIFWYTLYFSGVNVCKKQYLIFQVLYIDGNIIWKWYRSKYVAKVISCETPSLVTLNELYSRASWWWITPNCQKYRIKRKSSRRKRWLSSAKNARRIFSPSKNFAISHPKRLHVLYHKQNDKIGHKLRHRFRSSIVSWKKSWCDNYHLLERTSGSNRVKKKIGSPKKKKNDRDIAARRIT